MKSKLRVTVMLVLLVQLVGLLAYIGSVNAVTDNNIKRHSTGLGSLSNNSCLGCHASVKTAKSSNRRISTFHKKHVNSALLRFKCRDCHTEANLVEGTANTGDVVRKTVDPAICLKCHGAFASSAGAHEDKTIAQIGARKCKTCHTGNVRDVHEAASSDLINSINIKVTNSKSLCVKCHGGIQLYQAEETN